MLVKLLRDSKVIHKAGEIVEVSTAEYGFLLSVGSAEPVESTEDKPAEKPTKRTSKK